jgi:hypothetical protein
VTSYVISIDGETGTIFVDGEEPQLFGKVVGVDVKQPLRALTADLNPYAIHASDRPVVEVTLRLPLGPNDTLTILRGPQVEDVRGPRSATRGTAA